MVQYNDQNAALRKSMQGGLYSGYDSQQYVIGVTTKYQCDAGTSSRNNTAIITIDNIGIPATVSSSC